MAKSTLVLSDFEKSQIELAFHEVESYKIHTTNHVAKMEILLDDLCKKAINTFTLSELEEFHDVLPSGFYKTEISTEIFRRYE